MLVTTNATSVSIVLVDAAATRRLGGALARACRPGAIVLLQGPLGAGKTTLVDGFVQALGAGKATSPTFVIAHEHTGDHMPVWHLDLYRIEGERQVADLDLAQYVSDEAVTLCEWPERAPNFWPRDTVLVELAVAGSGRRATLSAGGPKSRAILEALKPR